MGAEILDFNESYSKDSLANNQWFFHESTVGFQRHWQEVTIESDVKIIDFPIDEIDTKSKNEIDTTKLTRLNSPYRARIEDLFSIKRVGYERYFLLSNAITNPHRATKEDNQQPKQKLRRVKNGRKKELFTPHMQYNDEWIEVNAPEGMGIYPVMLQKIIEQLDVALEIHRRVLVIRFDLHQPEYTSTSEHITKFRKRLIQKLQREYDTKNIGYAWVREREKAKSQHYHWVLFIDGDKVQYSSNILRIVKQLWCKNKELGYGGYVPTTPNPFYYCDNEDVRSEAIYRISYLAKIRGKGCRSKEANDYSTSRLKLTI